jgi:hypothetical protein
MTARRGSTIPCSPAPSAAALADSVSRATIWRGHPVPRRSVAAVPCGTGHGVPGDPPLRGPLRCHVARGPRGLGGAALQRPGSRSGRREARRREGGRADLRLQRSAVRLDPVVADPPKSRCTRMHRCGEVRCRTPAERQRKTGGLTSTSRWTCIRPAAATAAGRRHRHSASASSSQGPRTKSTTLKGPSSAQRMLSTSVPARHTPSP